MVNKIIIQMPYLFNDDTFWGNSIHGCLRMFLLSSFSGTDVHVIAAMVTTRRTDFVSLSHLLRED